MPVVYITSHLHKRPAGPGTEDGDATTGTAQVMRYVGWLTSLMTTTKLRVKNDSLGMSVARNREDFNCGLDWNKLLVKSLLKYTAGCLNVINYSYLYFGLKEESPIQIV